MIDVKAFTNNELHGGFRIVEVKLTHEPIRDALGREALAQTVITGHEFRLALWAGSNDTELSISIYHEMLEAAAIAADQPPVTVGEFNEGDFERAARQMHAMLGVVSPEKLNRMLQEFGFNES